jgi:hypothetical protein
MTTENEAVAVCVSPVIVPTSKNEYYPILAVSDVLTVRIKVEDVKVNTVESIVAPPRVVNVYVTPEHTPELTVKADIDFDREVPATLYVPAVVVAVVIV